MRFFAYSLLRNVFVRSYMLVTWFVPSCDSISVRELVGDMSSDIWWSTRFFENGRLQSWSGAPTRHCYDLTFVYENCKENFVAKKASTNLVLSRSEMHCWDCFVSTISSIIFDRFITCWFSKLRKFFQLLSKFYCAAQGLISRNLGNPRVLPVNNNCDDFFRQQALIVCYVIGYWPRVSIKRTRYGIRGTQ